MSSTFAIAEGDELEAQSMSNGKLAKAWNIETLMEKHKQEVLAFLAARPIHTVFMTGLINENGMVSFRNRAAFYGYRDLNDQLSGVALIGQKCLIETQDDAALEAFGQLAQTNHGDHLIRGEERQIEHLLRLYSDAGRVPRLVSRELLMEQLAPADGVDQELRLRLAESDDLDSVVLTNASMAHEESGVNPLEGDYQGVRERTARRIDQGRVWVLVEAGQIIFKADIVSETPQTAFIEGVYVRPEDRRKGHGLRCLTQLARNLLSRVSSICLVVNDENERAVRLYSKTGYYFRSHYRTAYFSAF